MQLITPEQIEAAFVFLESLAGKEQKKFLRKFQKKQEALLVYVAALIAREELDDAERDLLTSSALIMWKLTMDASTNQRMIMTREVDEADNDARAKLEKLLDADEDEMQEAEAREAEALDACGQPALVGFFLQTVTEAPEESGIRDEMKGILIMYGLTILRLLVRASA
jgi:hypothetical protein